MSKRLYVAYGSNLNIRQMKYRCPGAKLYGTGVIDDYELQFKGQPYGAFATIAPKEGASVPVAVWEISEKMSRRSTVTRAIPPTISSRMFPCSSTAKKSMQWYIS